ncbi:MAG TPA: hypothetical protein VFY71_05900 [Planctomycetota bacterium]|nr:hypothetical protein [Planctomycetota bacterium]
MGLAHPIQPEGFARWPFVLLPLLATCTAVHAQCVTGQLTPPIQVPGNAFGIALALDGTELVVGGQYEAAVFVRTGTDSPLDALDDGWVLQAELFQPQIGDKFGWAVGISGDHLVVGAPATGGFSGPGAAYVFRRVDEGRLGNPADDDWILEATLTGLQGIGLNANFGTAASLDGDLVAVGAPTGAVAPGELPHGLVHVFRHDDAGTPADPVDDTWIEEAILEAGDPQFNQHFGERVDLSGSDLLVGAYNSAPSGAVYHFHASDAGITASAAGRTWSQIAKIEPPPGDAAPLFGRSLDFDGQRVLIGAVDRAYLYVLDDNGSPSDPWDDVWVHQFTFAATDTIPSDGFGAAVGLRGATAMIGAPHHGALAEGAVYMYRELPSSLAGAGTTWQLMTEAGPPVLAGSQQFGTAVLLAGDQAFAGERGSEVTDAASVFGAVTVYAFAEEPWTFIDAALLGGNGEPCLLGAGSLAPGAVVEVNIADAIASAPAAIVIGLSAALLPFKGGLLVPAPDLLIGFATNASGGLELAAHWPASIPFGTVVHVQAWIVDGDGVSGYAASNGLRIDVP